MEHSLEEKLRAIKMCRRGVPIFQVAKQLGFSKNVITVWLEQYKQYGINGLERLPYNCRYDFKEKCKIVCEIEEKHVPLHVVSAKYRVARSTLHCWIGIVRKDGYDAYFRPYLTFLCSKITADGDCSHKIKRHFLLGRKVMTNLDSILKLEILVCQQRSI